jgi:hypothetical protein
MELQARAPLSPIGRRRVVDRVVAEGWSVAVAADAAAVALTPSSNRRLPVVGATLSGVTSPVPAARAWSAGSARGTRPAPG